MQLAVQFRRLLVARELHLLQVLVQVALVMVDRVLVLLVLAAPLVAHVPPVALVLLVPLALSVLVAVLVVDLVADPAVLVVDPVVPVLAVPVVEVVLVAALDRVVVVVLLAVVAVVAVVERMTYSRQ